MKAEAFIVTLETNSQSLAASALTEPLKEEKAEKRTSGTWTARVRADDAREAIDAAYGAWDEIREEKPQASTGRDTETVTADDVGSMDDILGGES